MTERLLLCKWDGEAMRPATSFWDRRAQELWVVGEQYQVEAIAGRSIASHNHYFAALAEAWGNLPDHLLEQFPSVEHLRKKALIQTGFRDERSIICASAREASRLAAFVAPMDDFAVVSVASVAVIVWTAKSQSMKAMGGKEFQRSKQAVLDFVAALIGVAQVALEEAGE